MKTLSYISIIVVLLMLTACNPTAPIAVAPAAPTQPGDESSATAAPSIATEPAVPAAPSTVPSPKPTFEPIPPTPTLEPLSTQQRQKVFDEVWTLVRDRYLYTDYRGLDWQAVRAEFTPRVANAPDEDAFYELMRELIERLGDEHSAFLSPQDVAQEAAEFDGTISFGGIGVRIREDEGGALITDVARGGPAEEAGLQRHELIAKIEGEPVAAGWDAGENPMRKVRGEPGTQVTITVRDSDNNERDVTLTRRVIGSDAFPPVQAQRLPQTNVGLVQLDTFNEDGVDDDVRTAIEEMLASGPLDGLIVDVRDNGGGRLDLLVNTVALFIDGGDIGSDSGQGVDDVIGIPSGQTIAALDDTPIAVLTGPDSVSAAEIFAAGMQARGRAVVVGEPSAGNTEVLLSHDISNGSLLRLAERSYRRPNGTLLEGTGVQPDRLVPAEWWRFMPQHDPQVLAALEQFKVQSSK